LANPLDRLFSSRAKEWSLLLMVYPEFRNGRLLSLALARCWRVSTKGGQLKRSRQIVVPEREGVVVGCSSQLARSLLLVSL
jgi:hypothetical protein